MPWNLRACLPAELLDTNGPLHHLQRYLVCVPELVQCFGALAMPSWINAPPGERWG